MRAFVTSQPSFAKSEPLHSRAAARRASASSGPPGRYRHGDPSGLGYLRFRGLRWLTLGGVAQLDEVPDNADA
jgi:hypothetical protein